MYLFLGYKIRKRMLGKIFKNSYKNECLHDLDHFQNKKHGRYLHVK